MSYTWQQARDELGRLVNDESDDGDTYSFSLRQDAYNRALEAFSAKMAVASSDSYVGDRETTVMTLPANMIDAPDAIFLYAVEDERYWTPAGERAKQALVSVPAANIDGDRFYYQWSPGTLTMSEAPAEDEEIVRFYYAYYNEVSNDTLSGAIEIPAWAREALLHYAAAYMINQKAVGASNLGQYKQRQDAGNPEHNPFEERANYFLKRYEMILSMRTSQVRRPPPIGTF